jgi:hypothetical protein
MKMHTRNATAEDAAWIAALCYRQFQVAHQEAWQKEDLVYAVDKMFSVAAVTPDIQEKGHHYFAVTEENENPLGCVKLGPPELDLAKKNKGCN